MSRPTPRELEIRIRVNVTDGPPLRRNTTQNDFRTQLGDPVLKLVEELLVKKFSLVAQDATAELTWSYPWMRTASVLEDTEELVDLANLDADQLIDAGWRKSPSGYIRIDSIGTR